MCVSVSFFERAYNFVILFLTLLSLIYDIIHMYMHTKYTLSLLLVKPRVK